MGTEKAKKPTAKKRKVPSLATLQKWDAKGGPTSPAHPPPPSYSRDHVCEND
jgi:hypothetical protein